MSQFPKTQALIDKMWTGDPDAILEGLHHGGALLRAVAVIFMTLYKLTSKEYLDGLYALRDDNVVVSGYKVSDFCICALDILGIEQYTGDDEQIRKLADTKFEIFR